MVADENCELVALDRCAIKQLKIKFEHLYRALKERAMNYFDESLASRRRALNQLPFCKDVSLEVINALLA